MNTEPYEVRRYDDIAFLPAQTQAIHDLMTAINGFPYDGAGNSAITSTIKMLTARPDICATLFGE